VVPFTIVKRDLRVDRGKQQIDAKEDIIDLDESVFEPLSDEDEQGELMSEQRKELIKKSNMEEKAAQAAQRAMHLEMKCMLAALERTNGRTIVKTHSRQLYKLPRHRCMTTSSRTVCINDQSKRNTL
jgi:hypothetical protein